MTPKAALRVYTVVGLAVLAAIVLPYADLVANLIIEPLAALPLPDWVVVAATIPLASFPPVAYILVGQIIRKRFSTGKSAIDGLSTARIALVRAIETLERLEEGIQRNQKEHLALQEKIASLQAISREEKESLERKLSGVRLLQPRFDWLQLLVGFALGIMSSLTASYMFERLNRRGDAQSLMESVAQPNSPAAVPPN